MIVQAKESAVKAPKMTINRKFAPLISSEAKTYNILTGGRGSGKSVVLSILAVLLTFERNENNAPQKILFTRYTASSKDFSIVAQVKAIIEILGLSSYFYIKQNEIINKRTSGQIIFTGIKTSSNELTAKLKSVTDCSTWILEEADELSDESEFFKIRNSIRKKGVKNRVLLALNPSKKTHWIYKTFFKNSESAILDGAKIELSKHKLVTHIHTSYLDNLRNLDNAFLQEIKLVRQSDRERYEREFLGAWGASKAGLVFPSYKVSDRASWDLTNLPNLFGLDVGSISPTALVNVRPDFKNKIVYLRELVYKRNLSFSERGEIVYFEYLANGGGFMYCDHNPDVIRDLNERGLRAQYAAKEVFQGLDFMKGFKIIVDKDSENLRNELDNYAVKLDASGQEQVIKANDHAIDAARYALYTFALQNNLLSDKRKKSKIVPMIRSRYKTY